MDNVFSLFAIYVSLSLICEGLTWKWWSIDELVVVVLLVAIIGRLEVEINALLDNTQAHALTDWFEIE